MAIWNKLTQAFLPGNKTLFEAFILSDKDGNTINSFGSASNIPLAYGLVDGYTAVHKFGVVDGTTGSSWNTVWTGAENVGQALYTWTDIADASVVTVVSSSGSDVTDVTFEGLDADYNPQSETLTLNGTSAVTGSKTWHRINRAYMAGTDTNVGKITISNATPTIMTEIKPERGQTLQAFYTVPAGCTAFLSTFQMISSKTQAVELSMFARPYGGAFRVAGGSFLYQMDHTIEYAVPVVFTEKTDIDVRAIGAANGTVAVSFDLIIVENTKLV